VSSDALAARIRTRFSQLEVPVSDLEIHQLSAYFWLLAKWNDRINLTALPVESGAHSAVDRLLVEPVMASRLVLPSATTLVDLGSGGGSPAFPLRIGAPQLRLVLVESRARKSAFLREVARSLELPDVEVANTRFESLASRRDLAGRTDLVTFRAVRADESLWATVSALLKPAGRAFWFGGPAALSSDLRPGLVHVSSMTLVESVPGPSTSSLAILERSSA
jgi:16S rRNA (guanine527-N7)-methyltransferase